MSGHADENVGKHWPKVFIINQAPTDTKLIFKMWLQVENYESRYLFSLLPKSNCIPFIAEKMFSLTLPEILLVVSENDIFLFVTNSCVKHLQSEFS